MSQRLLPNYPYGHRLRPVTSAGFLLHLFAIQQDSDR